MEAIQEPKCTMGASTPRHMPAPIMARLPAHFTTNTSGEKRPWLQHTRQWAVKGFMKSGCWSDLKHALLGICKRASKG
jgi:hypothetical protein